ncbi:MAG: hypothetical protein JXQ81_06280 [Desulfuromonadales bacterium]|nr:hypothetical protein [Desulfuromonadales bacterium]
MTVGAFFVLTFSLKLSDKVHAFRLAEQFVLKLRLGKSDHGKGCSLMDLPSRLHAPCSVTTRITRTKLVDFCGMMPAGSDIVVKLGNPVLNVCFGPGFLCAEVAACFFFWRESKADEAQAITKADPFRASHFPAPGAILIALFLFFPLPFVVWAGRVPVTPFLDALTMGTMLLRNKNMSLGVFYRV